MTRLPIREGSSALIVGCAVYLSEDLADLPSIEANVIDLYARLTDPETGGFAPDRCRIMINPQTFQEVFRAARELAKTSEDTFLLYFAGHGMAGAHRSDLYLCVSETDTLELSITALNYDHIKEILIDTRANNRIVVLDCCFSGRAFGGAGMGGGRTETIVGQAAVEGTYILAATSENALAVAPDGERHTAFTGALLEVLDAGGASRSGLLTLSEIYKRLHSLLGSRNRPLPRQVGSDSVADLALVRSPISLTRRSRVSGQSLAELSSLEIDEIAKRAENFLDKLSRSTSQWEASTGRRDITTMANDDIDAIRKHNARLPDKNQVPESWQALNEQTRRRLEDREPKVKWLRSSERPVYIIDSVESSLESSSTSSSLESQCARFNEVAAEIWGRAGMLHRYSALCAALRDRAPVKVDGQELQALVESAVSMRARQIDEMLTLAVDIYDRCLELAALYESKVAALREVVEYTAPGGLIGVVASTPEEARIRSDSFAQRLKGIVELTSRW